MKKHIIAFCSASLVIALIFGLTYSINHYPETVGYVCVGFLTLFLFFMIYFVIFDEI